MTKEKFNELMTQKDERRENEEYLAGIKNAVQDGETYEEHGEVQCEVENSLDQIDRENNRLVADLGVTREFFDEILDSCVVNRWELYCSIILNRG